MKLLYKLAAVLFGLQATVILAQPKPYVRTTPLVKYNPVGSYTNKTLRNYVMWDGMEPGKYNIQVKMRGLKPGDTLWLVDYHWDGKYMRDTAVIDKKGIASFVGNKKLQRGFYLMVMPKKDSYFEVLIDDDQEFYLETDTSFYKGEYYENMKIVGSDENTLFRTYHEEKRSLIAEYLAIENDAKKDTSASGKAAIKKRREAIYEKREAFDGKYAKAYPASVLGKFLWALTDVEVPKELPTLPDGTKDSSFPYEYYLAHFWDNIDLTDDVLARTPNNIIKEKVNFYFDKMVPLIPDSIIKHVDLVIGKASNTIDVERYLITTLLQKFQSSSLMGHDKIMVHIGDKYYCSGKAWWYDSASQATTGKLCDDMRHSLIGERGVHLQLRDTSNIYRSTEGVMADYYFVVFWDPTCGHCKEVLPKLANLKAKNLENRWDVTTIVSAEKMKEWKQFLKEHPEMGLFRNLHRGEVMTQAWADSLHKYYIYASPTIFILDKNRKIIANRIDVEKIPEFLKAWEAEEKRKGKLLQKTDAKTGQIQPKNSPNSTENNPLPAVNPKKDTTDSKNLIGAPKPEKKSK